MFASNLSINAAIPLPGDAYNSQIRSNPKKTRDTAIQVIEFARNFGMLVLGCVEADFIDTNTNTIVFILPKLIIVSFRLKQREMYSVV